MVQAGYATIPRFFKGFEVVTTIREKCGLAQTVRMVRAVGEMQTIFANDILQ